MDFVQTLICGVKSGDTIIDVGANRGGYCSSFREHCPDVTIHAFEPIPWIYRDLEERFFLDHKIHCWNLGVGAKCETVKGVQVHEAWTINKPGETSHSPNATHGGPVFDMKVTTLDAFLLHLQVTPISALKIDTDGYDFRVLQGGRDTIQRYRPRILIEFGYCITDLDGPLVTTRMIDWIDAEGYRIYNERGDVCPPGMLSWYPFNTTADFLLVPQEQELNPA
jgi:FkbM family methyltransferase